jgi:hypothetical protein
MCSPDEETIADKRKAVYDQDCKFSRYHGSFMYLRRIAQYEQGCVAYEPPKWTGPKGYALLKMAMALVNFANIGLLIDFGLKLR